MGSRARIAAATGAFVLTVLVLPGRPALGQLTGPLSVSPGSGQAGTTFTAQGGFPTGCDLFTLKWDSPHTVLGTAVGSQTVTATVPQGSTAGGHRVTANCVP